jgi:uncharacterized protein GlcG (DUF336 family)
MLTTKRLDLDDARALIAGARAKAEEIGVPMCIAIADESGQLIAFERVDGGKITSTLIAQDKASTAASAKRTTESYGEDVDDVDALLMPSIPMPTRHSTRQKSAGRNRVCWHDDTGTPAMSDGNLKRA